MANNLPIKRQRLDKKLTSTLGISRRETLTLLAKKCVIVDNKVILDADFIVDTFSKITVADKELPFNTPRYVMLNKPVGVVSATKDNIHKTVLDFINEDFKDELHIVGRLDLNSSGLVLLTNDSRWSEAITSPAEKIKKHYEVTVKHPLSNEYIEAFADGMYFKYENITTMPAILNIRTPYEADVTLVEGKYHQIKRMFGRFRNQVISLHRRQIGNIVLDSSLVEGQYRLLTSTEKNNIFKT